MTGRTSGPTPFILWTYADPGRAPDPRLRDLTERTFRTTVARIASATGDPGVAGFVFSDDMARATEVSFMLRRYPGNLASLPDCLMPDRALPEPVTIRPEFRERVNQGLAAAIAGDRQDGFPMIIALPSQTAIFCTPKARTQGLAAHMKSVSTLAHELGHAADFTNGRPGRPRATDFDGPLEQLPALLEAADVAQSEFMAVRAECRAMSSLFGGVSFDTFERIDDAGELTSARIAALVEDARQGVRNAGALQSVGYAVGTLCAYASSESIFLNKRGEPTKVTAGAVFEEFREIHPQLGQIIERMTPSFEKSARTSGQGPSGDDILPAFMDALDSLQSSAEITSQSRPVRGFTENSR